MQRKRSEEKEAEYQRKRRKDLFVLRARPVDVVKKEKPPLPGFDFNTGKAVETKTDHPLLPERMSEKEKARDKIARILAEAGQSPGQQQKVLVV